MGIASDRQVQELKLQVTELEKLVASLLNRIEDLERRQSVKRG